MAVRTILAVPELVAASVDVESGSRRWGSPVSPWWLMAPADRVSGRNTGGISMAHGTSRMPQPGPGDIAPFPAPSGRDPVVQSVRCCFRSARFAAQCLAALVSGGSRGDAADHAVADRPRPRSPSPPSPRPLWRSAGLSRSLAVRARLPLAVSRLGPLTCPSGRDCCGRKRGGSSGG